MKFDAEKNIALPSPQPVNIPAFSLLLRIDGVGATLQKALEGLPMLEASKDGQVKIFSFKGELPLEGIKPAVAIDGTTLYIATSIGFLNECRQRKTGLDQNVEFKKALALVGPEGNGLVYVSPRLFTRVRQLAAINPDAAPEAKRMFEMIAMQVPDVTQPLIAERINLPEGILVRSHWYRSLKQDVAMISVYNPVTIGFLAAMAIPAFQKVRANSQEKAINNNLRQFSAAAQQYMLENAKNVVTYKDIVGPEKYISELRPVAGEDYKSLVVHEGDGSISVRTAAGKVIEFSW
jgi:type IV pilus assembly protein PilA